MTLVRLPALGLLSLWLRAPSGGSAAIQHLDAGFASARRLEQQPAAAAHVRPAEEPQCLDASGSFSNTLRVSVPAGSQQYRDFEVPPLPRGTGDYGYAAEHAFVVLPAPCVGALGLAPNVGDLDGRLDQWMGRMRDLLAAEPSPGRLRQLLGGCACGWAIFAHGSGGFTFDNPRYCLAMAAAGYGVVAPDSFASAELGLRHRPAVEDLPSHLRSINAGSANGSYWCDNNVYVGDCTPAMLIKPEAISYPLCYDSSADAILSDAENWRRYYERVYHVRKMELDYMMEYLPGWIEDSAKVFLAGESEGGMVAARYFHPTLERLLERGGRIVLQWSCEWCYYVSCPGNAQLGGGGANLSTPVLNVISHVDPFFGPGRSIAWAVARAPNGYGAKHVTGNCLEQLKGQGFKHAYVVNNVGSEYHGLTETTGNLLRALLFGFLAEPRSVSLLSSLSTDGSPDASKPCAARREEGGVQYAECAELGPGKPVSGEVMPKCAFPGYKYHLQYHPPEGYERCSIASPSATPGEGSSFATPLRPVVPRLMMILAAAAA